jgi:hypothetical protein
MNMYYRVDEIIDGEDNVWIQGISETGKTTFLKFLFDKDIKHSYKWMLGGCPPQKSFEYYSQLIEDICRVKYTADNIISIYVDEIENENLDRLIAALNALDVSVRLVVVSHHLPPNKMIEQFDTYQMTDILSIEPLLSHIKEKYSITFPNNYYPTVSDCFFLIDNNGSIRPEMDIVSFLQTNNENSEKRKKVKSTVEHSIWILRSPEYERINLLKIKGGE